MPDAELSTWERGVFERFIEVCLDRDEAATSQLDHVTVVEREASAESGVHVRVDIDREAARASAAIDGSPFTLHADDTDGPFVELLVWLDHGYLSTIEGWKQVTRAGQAETILRLPEPGSFDKAEVQRLP